MGKSEAGKGPDPRPMTPEGRANYERTLRNIYGVRVKIPPNGPELNGLVDRLVERLGPHGDDGLRPRPLGDWILVKRVLQALAEEEG